MTKQEIESELEEISQAARKRMDESSSMMVSLLPCEFDWMTSEERARSHELKLQLPSYGEEALAARERLKEKRKKRLAEIKKGVNIVP